MTSVGLLGANGRMGKQVIEILALEFGQKARIQAQASQGEKLEPLLETDVVIDFSLPEGMLALTKLALESKKTLPAFVVGSTGWNLDQRRELEKLAQKTPVLISTNFSTGVQALLWILRQASPVMEKLGYSPVIIEAHHKHKKDAPSGTAISLQRAIAPAGPGNVQTHSIRAGETIGDHEVTFYGPSDHVTLGHFAQSRSIFARGAVEAALWLQSKRGAAGGTGKIISMENFFQERIQ